MEKLSTRLPADDLEAVEQHAEANDMKRATAARELIQSALADERGPSTDERVREARAEYEAEIDDLETDLERCRRARRQLLDQRDEHGDLVRAVEAEQSLAEKRAKASALQRLRWWATGMPDGEG